MLFSSGIGTYLQGLLKRLPLQGLEAKTHIYVYNEKAADWIRQYQPHANITICPIWIYGLKEQLYWKKVLDGSGVFWAPHFNIPWEGYEKLIVTLHDCFPLSPYASLPYIIYGKLMYRRIRQKADVILANSEFTRHEIHERARIFDIPTHVIPLGVDPIWFTSILPPRPFPFNYLLYVGNLKPHKNLRNLLKAIRLLKPSQKLVCVGAFKDLKFRDEKAFSMLRRMKDQVILTDRVEDDRLRAIVKHADGLVLPSFYEGFGLPPLEAMASRVPVLVSQAASLPEVCGNSALYCDPFTPQGVADGIHQLINLSGADRARRIAEGHEHAATFNWDKTAAATYEVLRTTLL